MSRTSTATLTLPARSLSSSWSTAIPVDKAQQAPPKPRSMTITSMGKSKGINISSIMTDFEEIGLDEDIAVRISAKRPPIRVVNTAQPIPLKTSTITASTRELVSHRPALNTIQSAPPLSPKSYGDNFLRLPVKSSRSKQRRDKSPARVSSMTSPRTLSPTPSSPSLPRSRPTRTTSQNRTVSSPASPGKHPAQRLPSWQRPNRRTIEEIEKDCDDDSGDDIPDDAVFWNIPVSPRAQRSVSSTSPSPERHLNGYLRHSSLVNVTMGISPPQSPTKRSMSTTNLPNSAFRQPQNSPPRGQFRQRGKSWGDFIEELGEDAKELTEELERHADKELEDQERKLQKNVAIPRRNSSPLRNIAVELPAKQVINASIDPVPISKEKEAIICRTRPTWLPPKSKKEEEKHLKQYQEMVRWSLEIEKKKQEKATADAVSREESRMSVHKIWDEKILPEWTTMVKEKSTRELWWKGIPPRSRGAVWQKAFGNALSVGEDTYKVALERAKKLAAEDKKTKECVEVIKKDISKTFVELKMFQKGCPMHEALLDVLMAYTEYRKDIGYVFGLHVIAANLLLSLKPVNAFITLANVLNRPLPLSFYGQDEGGMNRIYALFLRTFSYKLPHLFQHMHSKLCLPPSAYLEPMLSTLFALHVPIDIVSRLWDVYAFEGDAFLIRAAIAVLTVLEGRLYGSKEEVVALLGWNGGEGNMVKGRDWRLGNEEDFMAKVRGAGKEEVSSSVGSGGSATTNNSNGNSVAK